MLFFCYMSPRIPSYVTVDPSSFSDGDGRTVTTKRTSGTHLHTMRTRLGDHEKGVPKAQAFACAFITSLSDF